MRLIAADELLKLIKEQKVKETGAYAKGLNAGLNIVKSIVNDETQTPTAYDVNKVLKQLEERTLFLRDCSKYEHQTEEQREKSYSIIVLYEVAELVADLIDIVKEGGKNDN